LVKWRYRKGDVSTALSCEVKDGNNLTSILPTQLKGVVIKAEQLIP